MGKSTWINGIANYAKHSSLQDAMDDPEFTVLIPSRYRQFSNLVCFQKMYNKCKMMGNIGIFILN